MRELIYMILIWPVENFPESLLVIALVGTVIGVIVGELVQLRDRRILASLDRDEVTDAGTPRRDMLLPTDL